MVILTIAMLNNQRVANVPLKQPIEIPLSSPHVYYMLLWPEIPVLSTYNPIYCIVP